jgi:VanZ family protein
MAESITTARQSIIAIFVRYWLPVLLMIGIMFWFSSDSFSGDRTESIIDRILRRIISSFDRDKARLINFIVRKSAHFVEYAVLAALLYRAFRQDNPQIWRWRWALYAFTTIAAWALLDEYRQSLTSRREGSLYDSLLDVSGGLFALAIIALIGRIRDRLSR